MQKGQEQTWEPRCLPSHPGSLLTSSISLSQFWFFKPNSGVVERIQQGFPQRVLRALSGIYVLAITIIHLYVYFQIPHHGLWDPVSSHSYCPLQWPAATLASLFFLGHAGTSPFSAELLLASPRSWLKHPFFKHPPYTSYVSLLIYPMEPPAFITPSQFFFF